MPENARVRVRRERPSALAWALERREFLDAYNLGVANLSEARENLTIFNELAHGEEARA